MRIEMRIDEFFLKIGWDEFCRKVSKHLFSTSDEVDFSEITLEKKLTNPTQG